MGHLSIPFAPGDLARLRAGDEVELSGTVYAARDVAHRKLVELLNEGRPLPFALENAVIFYAGPTPARPGGDCGVVGPTTSKRMDPFTERLLEAGVKAMIGKGPRGAAIVSAIADHGAVYFTATGGAAAFLSTFVRSCEVVAWPELGPEAVWRLELDRFPAYVAIDAEGNDLFATVGRSAGGGERG